MSCAAWSISWWRNAAPTRLRPGVRQVCGQSAGQSTVQRPAKNAGPNQGRLMPLFLVGIYNSRRIVHMTEPQKTVAIIGAGPVGLAAAAHALERGIDPGRAGSRPRVGHAVRQWRHVPSVLAVGVQYRPRRRATARVDRLEFTRSAAYPTGDELVGRYLEPLATPHDAAQRPSTRRAASRRSAAWASTR